MIFMIFYDFLWFPMISCANEACEDVVGVRANDFEYTNSTEEASSIISANSTPVRKTSIFLKNLKISYDLLWFSYDFLWFPMISHDFPWFPMISYDFLQWSLMAVFLCPQLPSMSASSLRRFGYSVSVLGHLMWTAMKYPRTPSR